MNDFSFQRSTHTVVLRYRSSVYVNVVMKNDALYTEMQHVNIPDLLIIVKCKEHPFDGHKTLGIE